MKINECIKYINFEEEAKKSLKRMGELNDDGFRISPINIDNHIRHTILDASPFDIPPFGTPPKLKVLNARALFQSTEVENLMQGTKIAKGSKRR